MRFSILNLILMAAITVINQNASLFAQKDIKTWRSQFPRDVQNSILWTADHEEGTLFDWEYDGNRHNNGGGIFNTGKESEAIATVDSSNPLTGKYCAKATIHNAWQSQYGDKAVRLMRWIDKPWDQGGKFFPDSTYYGVWMRLDQTYSTQNPAKSSSGWWNVFQFKSQDENGKSRPVWVLYIGNKRQTGEMNFYLSSRHNHPKYVTQTNPIPIPVSRWFHVEAFYQKSERNRNNGSIKVWQDGKLILDADNVKTVLEEKVTWGIGNYTDHISGGKKQGTATIFFDDATISTKPTHKYVEKILQLRR